MTKKQKQSKKATKNSKRTKVTAKAEEETDTAAISGVAEATQATPATPTAEVAVEPQQAVAAPAPAAPAHTRHIFQSQHTQRCGGNSKYQTGSQTARLSRSAHEGAIDSCLWYQGLRNDVGPTHREVWHHSRNFSGCSGKGCSRNTTRPGCPDRSGEHKRDNVELLFTLGRVAVTPRRVGCAGNIRPAAGGFSCSSCQW